MATSTIPQVMNNNGSDAIGNYCKMPDGTLIQWGRNDVTTNNSSGITQYPYYGTRSIFFPIEFIGNPSVAVSVQQWSTYWMATASAATTKYITLFLCGNLNDTTHAISWIAIGRWK